MKTTFSNFAADTLENKRNGWAPGTYSNHETQLKLRLYPAFGDWDLDTIDYGSVEDWYDSFQRKDYNVRRASYMTLSVVMKRALRRRLIDVNPCQVEGAGKNWCADRPTWTPEQFEQVAAHLPGWVRQPLQVARTAALRIGEVCGLELRDWNPQTGILRVERQVRGGEGVRPPKGGRGREVAPFPEGADILTHRQRFATFAKPTDPMFTTRNGRRLLPEDLREPWREAVALAGFTDFRPHDGRHLDLTTFSKIPGVSEQMLMDRAGHRDSRTVKRYVHANVADQLAAVRLFEQMRLSA